MSVGASLESMAATRVSIPSTASRASVPPPSSAASSLDSSRKSERKRSLSASSTSFGATDDQPAVNAEQRPSAFVAHVESSLSEHAVNTNTVATDANHGVKPRTPSRLPEVDAVVQRAERQLWRGWLESRVLINDESVRQLNKHRDEQPVLKEGARVAEFGEKLRIASDDLHAARVHA